MAHDLVLISLQDVLLVAELGFAGVVDQERDAFFVPRVGDDADVAAEDDDVPALPLPDVRKLRGEGAGGVFEVDRQVPDAPEVDLPVGGHDVVLLRGAQDIRVYQLHQVIARAPEGEGHHVRADAEAVVRVAGGVVRALIAGLFRHIGAGALQDIRLVVHAVAVPVHGAHVGRDAEIGIGEALVGQDVQTVENIHGGDHRGGEAERQQEGGNFSLHGILQTKTGRWDHRPVEIADCSEQVFQLILQGAGGVAQLVQIHLGLDAVRHLLEDVVGEVDAQEALHGLDGILLEALHKAGVVFELAGDLLDLLFDVFHYSCSSTGASGAFFFTDSTPFWQEVLLLYPSLARMGSPFAAFRRKRNSPALSK